MKEKIEIIAIIMIIFGLILIVWSISALEPSKPQNVFLGFIIAWGVASMIEGWRINER